MKQTIRPLLIGFVMGSSPTLAEDTHFDIEVIGQDLDQIHGLAAHQFIEKLETELKNPSNFLEITDFQANVWLDNGFYHLGYSAILSTVVDPTEADRLVDMRGTIWYGLNAESEVLTINQSKIPLWQKNLPAAYPDHDLHYQVARVREGLIYHEAVLVTGDYKRSAK